MNRFARPGLPAAWLFALSSVASAHAYAHGPTPQKIDESVEIAAPPAKVWTLVGDFEHFEAWNPRVKSSTADKGNSTGSTRRLTLDSGGTVTEQLDEISATEMSMSYRSGREVDPKVLAVSSYSVRLKVIPTTSGSRLEWKARAYRADTGNEPAAGMDDAAAVRSLQELIQPALARAKSSLEGK
ncbi:MAG: SRPBCC family protein [Burkholderiales bacterium]|nr:SRPBCC family protein [Burkholderiales bacterium]